MLSGLLGLQSLQKMCHAELTVGRSLILNQKKFLLERRSWLSLTLLEKKEMGREMGGGEMSDWVFVEGREGGRDYSGTCHQGF